MTKIKLLSIIAILFTLGLSSCDNAEYKTIDNSVYMTDASGTSSGSSVTMTPNGVDIPINVRLGKAVNKDVTVTLQIDTVAVGAYNKANSTSYIPVQDNSIVNNAQVTIPAGSIGGEYTIHVNSFSTGGKQYALGVKLANATGGVTTSVSQGQYVYILSVPLNVSVPILNGLLGDVSVAPSTNWNITTPTFTLEWWANISAFDINNQALFYTGSGDTGGQEVYVRYGDANGPYNYIDMKLWGSKLTGGRDLVANTWYHWAIVYDGATITLYQNGNVYQKLTPSATPNGVRFDYMYMISSGSYFWGNCMMSQVRLWKTARNQDQIKNNSHFAVDPTDPNLILYIPMDEGSGTTFHDITGHGHDATCTNPAVLKGWVNNVSFP